MYQSLINEILRYHLDVLTHTQAQKYQANRKMCVRRKYNPKLMSLNYLCVGNRFNCTVFFTQLQIIFYTNKRAHKNTHVHRIGIASQKELR
jgi:hypothetical protein